MDCWCLDLPTLSTMGLVLYPDLQAQDYRPLLLEYNNKCWVVSALLSTSSLHGKLGTPWGTMQIVVT